MRRAKNKKFNLPLILMITVVVSGLVISGFALYFAAKQKRSREMEIRRDFNKRLIDARAQLETKAFASIEAFYQDYLRSPLDYTENTKLSAKLLGLATRHPVVEHPFLIGSRGEYLIPFTPPVERKLEEASLTMPPGDPKDDSLIGSQSRGNKIRFYRDLSSREKWGSSHLPGLIVKDIPPFVIAYKKMAEAVPGHGDIFLGFSISLEFINREIFAPIVDEAFSHPSLKPMMIRGYGKELNPGYPYRLMSIPFQKIAIARTLDLYSVNESFFEDYARKEMWLNYGLILALIVILTLGIYLFYRYIDREAELVRLKAEFLDTVSHTLKTPITRISLLAENVQQGWVQESETREEFFESIISETVRMNEMIDNMLNFSKIEAGKKVYDIKPQFIQPVISTIFEHFSGYMERLGFTYELEIDHNLPSFPFDSGAIRLVLVNLLQNSLKYSLEKKQVILRLYLNEKRRAVLEVEDQGLGIDEKALPHIFEKFYRAYDHNVRALEGSGLGLFLVYHAVRAHNGEIQIQSKPGKGTRISVVLPLEGDNYEKDTGNRR